ncbi:MAG: flagellar protein FlgN [Firmicutes bacterium]|nr:flagellar protein FlgN [Bacillota bacterium]
MKVDAAALIDILKSEKEAYQDLLDLSKKEQGLIVEGDAEGLIDVVRAEERLMFVVRDLEDRRQALLYEEAPDRKQSPPKLSTIVKNFDEQAASEALRLKNEILLIVNDLSETKQTNGELLKRSISYVNHMLMMLLPVESPTYSNKPNPQSSSPRLFDGRA